MHFSDRDKKKVATQQEHVCPKCSFNNHKAAIYCEICFYPLNVVNYLPPAKNKDNSQLAIARYQPEDNLSAELRKPSVVSGLLVLGLASALWLNYFIDRRPRYISTDNMDEISLYDSMSQIKDVPSGLFSYGGALYFAPLVSHGINDAVTKAHPNFDLRYTQPANGDNSYAHGIKMLLDGELSFAFNGRSLTDEEYAQAELRDIELLQVPIAIDGITVFGNRDLGIDNLSLDRVRDIFTGKITNWQQLGGADLPITPILLTPENLEILGIENPEYIPDTTKYASNYTLAVRDVIATPGAISFASTSLIQNQQGIKVFNLAAIDSSNYVAPIVEEQPNLEGFKNGIYPLTRRLFVVIRQDGTPERLAGKAYVQMLLSRQGQEIVEESGFVPLYNEQ